MHYDSRAKQIGEKFLERKYHRKEILFSYSVVLLCFIEGLTCIIHGVKDFITSLSQYYTKSNPTSIAYHLKWLTPIWGNNYGRDNNFFFNSPNAFRKYSSK